MNVMTKEPNFKTNGSIEFVPVVAILFAHSGIDSKPWSYSSVPESDAIEAQEHDKKTYLKKAAGVIL